MHSHWHVPHSNNSYKFDVPCIREPLLRTYYLFSQPREIREKPDTLFIAALLDFPYYELSEVRDLAS